MYSAITNFPQDSKKVKNIISIDSIFRENPDMNLSTAFEYTLPQKYKNVQSMTIKSTEIPISAIYTVSETNDSNFFNIKINENTYKIQINSGFYDKTTIVTFINNIFKKTNELKSLKYSIDPISQLSIFGTTATDISFEFHFEALDEKTKEYKKYDQILGGYLGFRENTPYICRNQTSIVSESPFGISTQKYVFLNIMEYSDAWNIDKPQLSVRSYPYFNSTYTMGLISLTNPINSVYTTRNYYGKGINIEKLGIFIVNKHGEIVDLNNNDFSFILEITVEE